MAMPVLSRRWRSVSRTPTAYSARALRARGTDGAVESLDDEDGEGVAAAAPSPSGSSSTSRDRRHEGARRARGGCGLQGSSSPWTRRLAAANATSAPLGLPQDARREPRRVRQGRAAAARGGPGAAEYCVAADVPLDWDDIARLREQTRLPVALKGKGADDAKRAVGAMSPGSSSRTTADVT
jgi:hypothetical protein